MRRSFILLLLLTTSAHAQTFYFPHYGDGSGLSMFFSVTNSSSSPAAGTIQFFAPDGTHQVLPGIDSASINLTLAPNQTVSFQSDGTSDPLISGYVRVDFDREEVSGLSILKLASGSEASVPPLELGSRFSLPVERGDELESGVALFRSESVEVAGKLYRETGELFEQRPFEIDSLQSARNLKELFPSVPDDFQGSLELECDCEFAPVGLRFGDVFSTITVADLTERHRQRATEIHSRHLPFGFPLGTPETNDLIVREIYLLSSNDSTKFSDWVAYRLDLETITGPNQDERNFTEDPELDESETLEPDDFDGAFAALGTDRGHLAPLASFIGTPHWRDTNFLSNIAPMESGLNRGGWRVLEDDVRELVNSGHVAFVITGTLYEEAYGDLPGADEDHRIPSGFWKIVATGDLGTPAATAFIFNQEDRGEITQRIVTIDVLETRSGFDFFSELTDDIEAALEAAIGAWPLSQQ